MTFSVDGIIVDTVNDPTYTTTSGIGFLIDGASIAGYSEEALFSELSITPYGNAAPDDSMTQALVTDQKIIASPYKTHIPGYGCDHGNGGWSPLDYENDPSLVSFSCSRNGFTMTPSQDGSLTLEDYFNRLGLYPQSYSMATTITLGKSGNVCAGIGITSMLAYRHIFVICSDGT